jgi:DNA polymerase I
MKVWKTTDPHPTSSALQEWVYNGLDSCITLEVLEAIEPQLNEITGGVYDFERALMGPILDMECTGILIDKGEQARLFALHQQRADLLQKSLDVILTEGIGCDPINPGSWQQKQYLLYNVLGLPPVRSKGRITTDRKALEKLSTNFYAAPICNHLMSLQDVRKKLGFLKTATDADGRLRCSYNIAGTDTGRLSSYTSAFGSGTNLQNVTEEMRRMFVADEGKRFAYIDLEQAESRGVGAIVWNLFHDSRYLDFCESGDLHTSVCRMTWPHLPWTGEASHDKTLAKQKFYRDFDYRDAAKRLGHGTNYIGKPPHMSREVRIPLPLVEEFQRAYFESFPGIREWHNWVRKKLLSDGWITTFMGRQRWFFGRRWEDDTVRSAVAFEPQSAIADYIDSGIIKVWRSGICQILAQVHDALLIQYDADREAEVVPEVQRLLEIEIPLLHGRSLVIPTEAMVGWNWGKAYDQNKNLVNPNGLVPFGQDKRTRLEKVSLMDRVVS